MPIRVKKAPGAAPAAEPSVDLATRGKGGSIRVERADYEQL